MNCVNLMGKCANDPEYKEIGDNKVPVATFQIAVSEPPIKEGGEWHTEWINIKAWRNAAVKIRDNLKKDCMVALSGSIKTESWINKDDNKKRYKVLVYVSNVNSIVIETQGY